MPTHIPQRVDMTVVASNHNQRVAGHIKRNVITRLGNLARMADEQPTTPPYRVELGLIDGLLGVKSAWQAVVRLSRCNQLGD